MGQGSGAGSGPTGRRQQAGFSVFLDQVTDPDGRQRVETRLYHAESGAETILPGALPEGWIGWIFERLGQGAGSAGAGTGAARAVLEVEVVEVLDVAVEARERPEPQHTVTARVVLRVTGVARVEREIGSEVLRGIVRTTPPP